ncbi:hypothetical protein AB0M46_51035, partial [Dactylosporangium sp. NPDC051485]|uniref:hypothetical protein n=1 Tax=Dactylosporangium sp. NPDC051485 TaxID=3154846 RepID=UPI0034293304
TVSVDGTIFWDQGGNVDTRAIVRFDNQNGLLTVLPWLGPLLGVGLAAALATLVPHPHSALLGLAAAALVTLAAAPAQHPPGLLGPLSIPAAAAAVVLGGALWGVFGALAALVLASVGARIRRRHRRPGPVT